MQDAGGTVILVVYDAQGATDPEDSKGKDGDDEDIISVPLVQTDCACRHGNCAFSESQKQDWAEEDRPNITNSKHRCCKCGAKISGLCLREDE